MALQVEDISPDTLRPHPDNPRMGDVDVLVESLRTHGQYKPLVISEDGVILAGNHTYMAAMELGMDSVAVVRMPFPWDDPRATKILLVDNRSSDTSRYQNDDLLRLLSSLDDDLLGTGYTDASIDDLLALVEEQDQPLSFPEQGVTTLPNLQEKLEKYQSMGRRMIVLDYSQEEYPRITQQLERLRGQFDVPSNAQAVQRLLDQEVEFV